MLFTVNKLWHNHLSLFLFKGYNRTYTYFWLSSEDQSTYLYLTENDTNFILPFLKCNKYQGSYIFQKFAGLVIILWQVDIDIWQVDVKIRREDKRIRHGNIIISPVVVGLHIPKISLKSDKYTQLWQMLIDCSYPY